MLILVVRAQVAEKNQPAFIDLFSSIRSTVLAEEGCYRYDLLKDLCNEAGLVIYEEWQSMEHQRAHLASAHMKPLLPRFAALLNAKSDELYFDAQRRPND